jgi:hypothetical protein
MNPELRACNSGRGELRAVERISIVREMCGKQHSIKKIGRNAGNPNAGTLDVDETKCE